MGRRGPKPKPAAVLRLHGNPKANAWGDAEPQADTAPPAMPPEVEVDALASETWREACRLLGNMGLLSATDTLALARYCVTYSRWRALLADVRKNGEVHEIIDAMGNEVTKTRAAARLLSELSAQLTRLEGEFGLTPSSRSSIGRGLTKAGKDPMDTFLAPSVSAAS